MVRLCVVVAVVCASACYHPSFRECAISCDSADGCPSGLSCDMTAHMCSSTGTCSGVTDAHADTAGSATDAASDGAFACWPFIAANYRPCETGFPAAEPAVVVTVGTTQFNTDDPSCDYDNGTVCLRHLAQLTVLDHMLIVVGHRPLIIVSDGDVAISGGVPFDSVINTLGGQCDAATAPNETTIGGGGGGGGYGAQGAPGGAGPSGVRPAGGSAFGMPALEPLLVGCRGADGGLGGPARGGTGGFGGGALEISSMGAVIVNQTGFVTADGGGAVGGAGLTTSAGGGGGGGGGGSVLLEGRRVTVTGQVCATGGGGGQGAVANGNGTSGNAGLQCASGIGGAAGSGLGAGGNGAGINPPVAGTDHSTSRGGGGGGGAIGRIRIHTASPDLASGTIVPMPLVQ